MNALAMPYSHEPNLSAIARTLYGRDWTTVEYRHDPALVSNVFACFSFKPEASTGKCSPWVVHFAYRRAGARDGMWRPYGSVIRIGRTVSLISESGDLQEKTFDATASQVAVETYFGPGAAEFRVASLHKFELKVAAPSHDSGRLRFSA